MGERVSEEMENMIDEISTKVVEDYVKYKDLIREIDEDVKRIIEKLKKIESRARNGILLALISKIIKNAEIPPATAIVICEVLKFELLLKSTLANTIIFGETLRKISLL